jgi:hypothetical protein
MSGHEVPGNGAPDGGTEAGQAPHPGEHMAARPESERPAEDPSDSAGTRDAVDEPVALVSADPPGLTPEPEEPIHPDTPHEGPAASAGGLDGAQAEHAEGGAMAAVPTDAAEAPPGGHQDDLTTTNEAAGAPLWEPGVHPDDEATTVVQEAGPLWEPGVHPEDEATTIVTAAAPAWEPGVHPDDEATTIVTGPAPEWEPGVHPDDEATTIVTGPAPAWEPGVHPDDEATTIVSAPAPAWEPGVHPDDEATTIVTGPAPAWEPGVHPDDEATTVVSGPAPEWEPGVHPDDEATVVAGMQPASAPGAQRPAMAATAPLGTGGVAARGAGDTTAVVPGSLSVGETMPGQGWFDARLRDFMAALTKDEHGQPRAKEARQMLGAAARDMIARIVMQGGPGAGQEWAADTVLQPDQLLANTYIVRSLIARGGIGEIYRVRHRDLKTEHAVKILLPRYALDPTLLSLMLEEARLLQCVRHEAVVGCQGLLRDVDGRPVLVMDYIRGRTLSGRLRDGPLSTEELVVLARRLAEALSAIHAAGIVHQDMSPDNVMLSEDSVAAATVIDFGLARPLGSGSTAQRNLDFAGKFSWASPEQLSGRPGEVDARSDLYSLGLILMAAARGYRLDMGHDMESARSARRTVPSLAGIESPVADLLRLLLDPQKTGRPSSASEIAGLLSPRPTGIFEQLMGRLRFWRK